MSEVDETPQRGDTTYREMDSETEGVPLPPPSTRESNAENLPENEVLMRRFSKDQGGFRGQLDEQIT